MIRDPSDGTIREKTEDVFGSDTGAALCGGGSMEQRTLSASDLPPLPHASGLPITKGKAEYLARLEKSREWMKNRFQSDTEQTATGLRSPTNGEG